VAPFIVRPGDLLRIRVWPDSLLSGRFPIEETGYVYLPVLGAIRAGGVRLSELRATLRRMYGEALKAPAVEVTPIFKVSVLGGVVRPGLYQVDPTQTLFDAISLAGGFAPGAKQNHVRLIRGDSIIEVNAKKALRESASPLALSLQSGDRIVVPPGMQWRAIDIFYGIQSLAVLITLIAKL
ncbi:MAG TPA: polysaccharide biosynthesis/export family protein, partial [Longimicrobiales bacterium]|nr:polysaccharide biosynthesis/export family protein [Longimicrobiales bacterium]